LGQPNNRWASARKGGSWVRAPSCLVWTQVIKKGLRLFACLTRSNFPWRGKQVRSMTESNHPREAEGHTWSSTSNATRADVSWWYRRRAYHHRHAWGVPVFRGSQPCDYWWHSCTQGGCGSTPALSPRYSCRFLEWFSPSDNDASLPCSLRLGLERTEQPGSERPPFLVVLGSDLFWLAQLVICVVRALQLSALEG